MIEAYRTYDPIEADLIEAKLKDEGIEYVVSGNSNLAMTMDTFNSELNRMAVKRPIKFFVDEENLEKARLAIEKDNSEMMGDDLEY